jgi:hypothetical protein
VTQPINDKLLQNDRDEKWRVGLENLEISEAKTNLGEKLSRRPQQIVLRHPDAI